MKELIKKLTDHYAWCIENMPKEGWHEFCEKNNIKYGICYCSNIIFGVDIYSNKFIEVFTNDNGYLCKFPAQLNTFKEALETLRTRHKRLLEMADYKE